MTNIRKHPSEKSEVSKNLDQIIREYLTLKKTPYVEGNRAMGVLYRRLLRPAKEIYNAADHDIDVALRKIHEVNGWADSTRLSWSLETVIKRWFENNEKEKPRITTDERWKDKLPNEDQADRGKNRAGIDSGILAIKDIMEKRGLLIRKGAGEDQKGDKVLPTEPKT